jgi:hypothetical protein
VRLVRTDGASGKTACALVTLAFALATGCVGGQSHPYELAETQLGAPGVERVLLLPLNTLSELPRELDGSTRRVTRHIRSHLEACGVEITPMGLVEARGVWAELDEVAGEPGEARVARFARRLHEGGDVDAVVLPSLVVREARIQAVTRRVEWDGVRRQLEVKGHLDKHGSGSISQMNVRGDMPVISLHLAVYDPNGVRGCRAGAVLMQSVVLGSNRP